MRFVAAFLVVGFAGAFADAVHADVISVTTTADDGPGSLRAAITLANDTSGADIINLTATGTIQLASPLPPVRGGETDFVGPGAAMLTVRGDGTSTVFALQGGPVSLSGLTISGGGGGDGRGGAIRIPIGPLTVTDCVITGNARQYGAAIAADVATLTITRSRITGNTGTSIIQVGLGAVTIRESTIADNTGTAIAVGATSGDRRLVLEASTVSGNAGGAGVGGLAIEREATLTNVTLDGNTGAVASDLSAASTATVHLVAVTATSAGPSVAIATGATVDAVQTIFAGTGARCTGALTSLGHNVSSDASCGLTSTGDSESRDEPLVAALADNGGPTRTRMPVSRIVIDNSDSGMTSDTDQRGAARRQFGAQDIGAVEVQAPVVSAPVDVDVAVTETFMLTVTATNPNSALPLTYQWRRNDADIPGATGPTYSKAAAIADIGDYVVEVTNEGGTITSAIAHVSVHALPSVDAGINTDPPDDGGCCSTGASPLGSLVLGLLAAIGLVTRRR